MAAADARAIAAGASPLDLVDRAASAIARVVRGRWTRRPVRIACGPGSNGADGWALAWMLEQRGWDCVVHTLGEPRDAGGALGEASRRFAGRVRPITALAPSRSELVVDALFGAGLSRDVAGEAADALERVRHTGAPVLAVDLPSGVDGASGAVRGMAVAADATVTFHRLKPGHLLSPGRALCGAVFLADIGLEGEDEPDARVNGPTLWTLPRPEGDTHKYARGSVVVASGGHATSGAARLTAEAAARAGSGAVTLASPPEAVGVNAAHCDAIMVRAVADADALAALIAERGSTAVLGPGMGRGEGTRTRVLTALSGRTPIVLDADALTSFEEEPGTLFAALHGACVLTPHEGEFGRLFGDLAGSKLDRAASAASRAGCTVLLKGTTTVVATPGAVPILSDHGTPWLATAGSGDTLCGVIAAFLAQGLPAHDAAAAGAWVHGGAGRLGGAGMTADDLSGLVGRAYAAALC